MTTARRAGHHVDVHGQTLHLRPRAVAADVEELLAGATERMPFGHDDGKSEAPFERVVIDGERFVVKHLHVDHDWIARGYGDLLCRPLTVWRSGLLDAVPAQIDHTVVGAAAGLGRNGWGAAILMRDVAEHLVPPGDAPVPEDQHRTFLTHMAALHVSFWGFEDTVGLTSLESRWQIFGPAMLEIEAARPSLVSALVPAIAGDGWGRFSERAPRGLARLVDDLRHDIDPLAVALRTTPSTFVHGDWKLGNLGSHPDGRTILIDWQSPGAGPAAGDLCWYLALNAARIPESKEAAIDAYHAALESHGVTTAGWWSRQLGLCLLGTVVQFGWEKALGAQDEFDWWCERADEGAAWL